MGAAEYGHTDVATLLLGAGANMDITGIGGFYNGNTALDLARLYNRPEIVAAALRLEYWTPTTHRLCQGARREWVRFVLLVLLKRLGLPHVVAVVVVRHVKRSELGDGRAIAFTLNLARDWTAELGGALVFVARDGGAGFAPDRHYAPRFNVMQLFDVSGAAAPLHFSGWQRRSAMAAATKIRLFRSIASTSLRQADTGRM